MTRATRRAFPAAVLVALVIAALALGGAAWWFNARTRPDAVSNRVVAQLVERHPGASVATLGHALLRVTMPSGLYIDARLEPAIQKCRDDRFDCSNAIDRIVADVERAGLLSARPRLADLRARVIGESSPGFRFGFVTEPLIGALEVRYALVAGAASTFVTSTIADRLGVDRAQLRQAALMNLAAEGEARAELLSDSPGVYRVISNDDAVANLLDAARMQKLATLVGSNRLYCAVPERGVLLLVRADAAGKQALIQRARSRSGRTLDRERDDARPGAEPGGRSGQSELFVYDKGAPEGQALSMAGTGP
ncbi:MAG: hypothetical protein ACR2GP_03470 [Burkholderiaceae bacterium]